MYKILCSDDNDWNKYLEALEDTQSDIYYTSEYHKIYEKNGDGKALMFVYSKGDKLAVYPFLINDIKGYGLEKSYYDIETVYGYGGPTTNSEDEEFLTEFEQCFNEYCIQNNIVAEFIRFHPLLNNHGYFKNNIDVIENRTTVYVDLSNGYENVWNGYASENRNRIRKANKNNLSIEWCNDYKSFKNIYEHTMNRVSATENYYFNDEYFSGLIDMDKVFCLNVKRDEKIIGSAIFMIYKSYAHYHLGASLTEHLKLAPNNFIMDEGIKLAISKGCKYFHLGGGLTNCEHDNLFRFKHKFSKNTCKFYIGKRIHNKEVYNHLIEQWKKNSGNLKQKIFLEYKNI